MNMGLVKENEEENIQNLISNTPGAEHKFLRQKLKTIDDNIEIAWIPDNLYQMLIINLLKEKNQTKLFQ